MRLRSQSGQTTAEYLGVLVVVAIVVAALVLGNVGHLIGTGARAKVCDIARHPCGTMAGSSSAKHHRGGIGGFFDSPLHGLGTGLGVGGRALGSVGVGIYEGVKTPVELGIKLSPLRLQTDPIGFFHDGKEFVSGLGQAVTHPKELGKAVLDWNTWANDPARAVGHLIPNIALVLATGGTGEVADGGEAVLSAEARAAAENELQVAAERESQVATESERGVADAEATATEASLMDYSTGIEKDLAEKFVPGTASFHSGILDEDLYLAQFYDDSLPLGKRSLKWWTTRDEAATFRGVDDVRRDLALPPEWGDRNAIAIARVPKGTSVDFYYGQAQRQIDATTGIAYKGGGPQMRFMRFDPKWIVDTRPFP